MTAAAMPCPKCGGGRLEDLTLDGMEVNRCAGCQGIWFDKGELGGLLGRETTRIAPLMGGDDPADLDDVAGRCPRDRQRLLRVLSARNQQVWIDTCRICQGIWLDGGEFERLKRAAPGLKLGDLI
jgi:uncharacterized protein